MMADTIHRAQKIWTPSEDMTQILRKDHVSAREVREVIEECFYQAHGDPVQARFILRNQFAAECVSWDEPTREGLERIIPRLENIAIRFRNPEIITKNRLKVKGLLRKCCDS